MGVNDLLDRYQVGTQHDQPRLQEQHTESQWNVTEERRSMNQQDNRSSRNGLNRETLNNLRNDGIDNQTGHGSIYGSMNLKTKPEPLEGIITGPKNGTPMKPTRDRLGWLQNLTSQLPELWGIDLTLILVTVVGVLLILFNLSAILLFIARAMLSIFELSLLVVFLLIIIWLLVTGISGRRRR